MRLLDQCSSLKFPSRIQHVTRDGWKTEITKPTTIQQQSQGLLALINTYSLPYFGKVYRVLDQRKLSKNELATLTLRNVTQVS